MTSGASLHCGEPIDRMRQVIIRVSHSMCPVIALIWTGCPGDDSGRSTPFHGSGSIELKAHNKPVDIW